MTTSEMQSQSLKDAQALARQLGVSTCVVEEINESWCGVQLANGRYVGFEQDSWPYTFRVIAVVHAQSH